jgi:hypothetical protein
MRRTIFAGFVAVATLMSAVPEAGACPMRFLQQVQPANAAAGPSRHALIARIGERVRRDSPCLVLPRIQAASSADGSAR